VKLPLTLLALGVVSLFPQTATALSDRLAFVVSAHQVLLPAASWLARYEWVGVLSLGGGLYLAYKRLTHKHEKKLL
jgi:hypothetical protein